MGKIYVADAIMGSGKTSAAIQYMLDHPENRYLYITPYIDETERVCQMCKKLKMVVPPMSDRDKAKTKGKSKVKDDALLLCEDPHDDRYEESALKFAISKRDFVERALERGLNVVTTHALFKNNTLRLVESVRKHNYVIIIDEAIDTLEIVDFDKYEIGLFTRAGALVEVDNRIVLSENERYQEYDQRNGRLMDIIGKAKEGTLLQFHDECRFWAIPKDIFEASECTLILTYMFESQLLRYYFDIMDLDYQKIGVHFENNKYRFCTFGCRTMPAYTQNLHEMITILENKRMNSIGDDYYALSKNWFKKNLTHEGGNQLRRNLDNFHKHITSDIPGSRKLWASCKIAMKDFGISRAKTNRGGKAVSFNYKASNEYRHCEVFSYLYNVFFNGTQKIFLQSQGCEIDKKAEERFALSIMLQCMWRTAIRDGKHITVYVPSARMRQLLKDWIVEVEEEYRQYISRKTENNGEVELWEME